MTDLAALCATFWIALSVLYAPTQVFCGITHGNCLRRSKMSLYLHCRRNHDFGLILLERKSHDYDFHAHDIVQSLPSTRL